MNHTHIRVWVWLNTFRATLGVGIEIEVFPEVLAFTISIHNCRWEASSNANPPTHQLYLVRSHVALNSMRSTRLENVQGSNSCDLVILTIIMIVNSNRKCSKKVGFAKMRRNIVGICLWLAEHISTSWISRLIKRVFFITSKFQHYRKSNTKITNFICKRKKLNRWFLINFTSLISDKTRLCLSASDLPDDITWASFVSWPGILWTTEPHQQSGSFVADCLAKAHFARGPRAVCPGEIKCRSVDGL